MRCSARNCFEYAAYRVRLKNPKTGEVDFTTTYVCLAHHNEAARAGLLVALDAVPAPKIVEVGDQARSGLGRLWEGESIKQKGVTMPVCSVCKMRNGKNQGGKVICRSCMELAPAPVGKPVEKPVEGAGWSSSVEVVPRRDIEDLKSQVAGLEQELKDRDAGLAELRERLADSTRENRSIQADLEKANANNADLGAYIEGIDQIIGFNGEEGTDENRLVVLRQLVEMSRKINRRTAAIVEFGRHFNEVNVELGLAARFTDADELMSVKDLKELNAQLELLKEKLADLEILKKQSLQWESATVGVTRLTRADLTDRVAQLHVIDQAREQLAAARSLPIGSVEFPLDEETRIFLDARLADRENAALVVKVNS